MIIVDDDVVNFFVRNKIIKGGVLPCSCYVEPVKLKLLMQNWLAL